MTVTSVTVKSQYDGPTVVYTLAADSALLGDRLTVVQTAEADLRGTLDDFVGLATTSESLARTSLEDLAAEAPEPLPRIEFTAPEFTNTTFTNPTAGRDLSLQLDAIATPLSVVESPNEGSPTLTHIDLDPTFTAPAPVQSTPDIPGTPTLEGVPSTPPADLAELTLTVPEAPTLPERSFSIGEAPEPNLQELTFTLPDPVEFDSVEFLIDDSILQEAVDRLSNVFTGTDDIPDYEYLFPEVFRVVGNMLSGRAVNDDAFAKDPGIVRRVAPSLARRGHIVPDAVIAYDVWAQDQITEFTEDSESLFLGRFSDSVIVAAYTIAQQAEAMAANIATRLYSLRRALEVERAKATLAIAQAVAASYNAYVALYEARVAEYNGQLAVVRGAIRALNAEVQARSSVGETNQLIAREFAQRESVKKLDVDLFAAQIQAEAAKLEGYRAKIESYEGLVANARGNALSYTATAAQYSGQVEQVKARYSAYETSADATGAQNRLAIATQRGVGAEYGAEAAKAEAAARRISATVLGYVADHEALKIDVTDYLGRLSKSSGEFGACIEADLNDIRDNRLDNLNNVAPREYLTEITDRFNRYAKRASDIGWRTLEGSLRASESLAQSYARMYEALGRAAASIEVGRLGQFRASYSSAVAGSIGTSSGANRTTSTTRTLSNEQQNVDTQSD